jgi:hypothetical protein
MLSACPCVPLENFKQQTDFHKTKYRYANVVLNFLQSVTNGQRAHTVCKDSNTSDTYVETETLLTLM